MSMLLLAENILLTEVYMTIYHFIKLFTQVAWKKLLEME